MFKLGSKIAGFNGLCFLGDTHLASGRVGRRIDDYAAAGLDKLRQAAAICRDENLLPIHLGDLFHKPKENYLPLLAQVMAVMREFPHPPLVVAGSHDRTESWFTDKDAAQLLADAGVVYLLQQPGEVFTLACAGVPSKNARHVRLWVTPAGCRIPDELPPTDGETLTIMVTHHDLDFRGMYPGATELHEIANCQVLVNGHMHTPTPMVIKGGTTCHNPGSMMRVSVDLKNHEPAVSVWTPAHGSNLERRPLKIATHVFDLTGKEVYAADPKELKASLPKGLRLSSFAAKLRGSDALESGRSDDGAVMVEQLDTYFKMFDKPDNLRRYLSGLLKQVIEEKTSVK